MAKRAILYTRVSTDEQNNGYSPLDQKDKLYNYCEMNKIEVVGFYHDDESGKTFNRPEWKNIITFLKKNKNSVDYICFLKWDRFSRSAEKAYEELSILKKLGVEAVAIEQKLDLEIPEQKLMLAIYLTTPEIDNDRRSLNIFHGIRKGKKQGRWLGACPRGYKNTRNEINRPVITPEGGLQEKLVVRAFNDFSTGNYSIESLRLKLYKEGLKCNRNSFWMLLRNRVYIGQIFIPAYKDEPEEWIQGIHLPLISENVFYKVQDILEGRKKHLPSSLKTIRDEFPLRGILICPQCGKYLTASCSKGKMGVRYPYYHCTNFCKERKKAEVVNNALEGLLETIKPSEGALKIFSKIVNDKITQNNQTNKIEGGKINTEISKLKKRIENAKNLMLDGEIEVSEFKTIRISTEDNIKKLSIELNRNQDGLINIKSNITEASMVISNLAKAYKQSNTSIKRQILSSIFSSGLIFEEKNYRTLKINEVIAKILRNSNACDDSPKKKAHQIWCAFP
jgi:site-specific DNA recombinase